MQSKAAHILILDSDVRERGFLCSLNHWFIGSLACGTLAF